MPLSPTELVEEELVQLRRLAQSPGWGLLKTRAQKQLASSEAEKAHLLREGNTHAATLMQGRVDGWQDAITLLDAMLEEHQEAVHEAPDPPRY